MLLRLLEALQPLLEAKNIAGFSDGSALVYSLKDDDSLDILSEWKEPRSKETKFIGLSLSPTSVRLLPTFFYQSEHPSTLGQHLPAPQMAR